MVARGDLGVEIGPAAVPLLQKRIILRSLERGKPVITATQMLESMIHQPEPTRAEASDVANAILDGTSAVMLSGETAVGEYPARGGRDDGRDRARGRAEPRLPAPDARRRRRADVGNAMSNAACDLAEALGAPAILVPTFSGRTASVVARLRPRRPIVGLSHHQLRAPADGARVGRDAAPDPGVSRTSRISGRCSIEAAREAGLVRAGRPRRDHRGHGGEHPRLDERDQGRLA